MLLSLLKFKSSRRANSRVFAFTRAIVARCVYLMSILCINFIEIFMFNIMICCVMIVVFFFLL